MNKPLVFISCGQYAAEERRLGADICALVKELRPDMEPYFADNQSSADGLSTHILNALSRSAGFVCVMHRRGNITLPDGRTVTRGSVWLEQEIAIVAFMGHVLGRPLPTFYYKQSGIGLEGIRSVLLMNPRIEFTHESQVLEDLRQALPGATFNAYAEYDLIPEITYRDVSIRGDLHVYSLVANVKNVGRQRIVDFELRIMFPRAFLNPNVTWGAEDPQRSTRTHICFVADAKIRAPGGLYPGDGMKNPLTIEYFVNHDLFHDRAAMQSEIVIELFSGSMTPKKSSLPISRFQKF